MSKIEEFKKLLKDREVVTRTEAVEYFKGDSGLVSRLISLLSETRAIENHEDGFRLIKKKKFVVEISASIVLTAKYVLEANTKKEAWSKVDALLDNNYEAFISELNFNQPHHSDVSSVEIRNLVEEIVE